MNGAGNIAGVLALLMGASVFLLLGVFGVRRYVRNRWVARLSDRVRRVQGIIAEHRQEKFERIERMLFQLAEVQDWEAVESALSTELEDVQAEELDRVRRVFAATGLTPRLLADVRGASSWSKRAEAARTLGMLQEIDAIPKLVEAMRDPEEDVNSVKLAAAQALGQMKVKDAVPMFLQELRVVDEWASPRIAAILVSFGEAGLPALVESLGDEEHVNVRVWAAQILGRVGRGESVTPLLARLSDRSEQVRMSAAEALGRIGDRRAVNELLLLARRDPVAPVRAEAARAIGLLGDDTVVRGLVTLLGDPDYWTRLRAIEAIEMIRPSDTSPLDAALRDSSGEVRGRAAVALERIGVLAQRVEELGSEDRALSERAHRTLVEMGKAGLVESIIAYLENDSFRVRSRMAEVLGEVGSPQAVSSLIQLISDDAWPVRVRAVEAIGRICPKGGVAMVLPALSDGEETVRAAAIVAIQHMGAPHDEAGLNALVQLAETSNAEVRANVVRAIGHLRQERVDALLSRGLGDPSALVRLRSVEAIAERAEEAWLAALEDRLGDPELSIRIEAAEGLGRIDSSRAVASVVESMTTPSRELREALSGVLAKQGVDRIIELFGEPRTIEERLGLVWSLGKTQQLEALVELDRFATDPEAEVRAAVAGALGKIREEPSRLALEPLVEDRNERVRAAAVNALGSMGSEASLPALERALDDPDAFVRNRSAIALGRVGGARSLDLLEGSWARHPDAASRAYAVIGFGLLENDGFKRALDALESPSMRTRVDAVLRREPAELRDTFFDRLRLRSARRGADLSLAEGELAAHYAQIVVDAQDAHARQQAVVALSALGADPYRALLMNVVRTDPDPKVRISGIQALSDQTRDPDVVALVIDSLRDPAREVAHAAAAVVSRVATEEHNAVLLRTFAARDPKLDGELVEALVRANAGAKVLSFIDELMGHVAPEILQGGAKVLAVIADPRSTPLLMRWLEDREPKVRASAVDALGAIGTVDARRALLGATTDPSESVRMALMHALDQVGGSEALEGMKGLCKDPSLNVRLAAGRVLAQSRSAIAIDLAQVLLDDPHEEVRVAAMVGLLRRADGDSTRLYAERWPSQPETVKRRLREIGSDDPGWQACLHSVSEDPSSVTRAAAMKVLGTLGGDLEAALLRALRDPAAQVRLAAIEAAHRCDTEETRAVLEGLLRDPDAEVRDAVRRTRITLLG